MIIDFANARLLLAILHLRFLPSLSGKAPELRLALLVCHLSVDACDTEAVCQEERLGSWAIFEGSRGVGEQETA